MIAGSVIAVFMEIQGMSVLGLPGAAVGTLVNLILFFFITAVDPKAKRKALSE